MSDDERPNEVILLTHDTLLAALKESDVRAPVSITVSPDLQATASEVLLSKMRLTPGGYLHENMFASIRFNVIIDDTLPAGEWHLGAPRALPLDILACHALRRSRG